MEVLVWSSWEQVSFALIEKRKGPTFSSAKRSEAEKTADKYGKCLTNIRKTVAGRADKWPTICSCVVSKLCAGSSSGAILPSASH